MTPEELQDRVHRIRRTVANIRQALKFIDTECDLLQEAINNENQLELFKPSS
jgi:hypothetical protein